MGAKRLLVGAVVAAATLAVVNPSSADAADATVWSTSGNSYVWYDDAGNRVVSCDIQADNGVAASTNILWNGATHGFKEARHYNNCVTLWQGLRDGEQMRIKVCDWAWNPSTGVRHEVNCRVENIIT